MQREYKKLAYSSMVVLLMAVLIFEFLLYNKIYSEIWTNTQFSARIAFSSIETNSAFGLRVGIQIDRFQRLKTMLDDVSACVGFPLAVLDSAGRPVCAAGDFPPAFRIPEQHDSGSVHVFKSGNGKFACIPLMGRGELAGYAAAFMAEAPVRQAARTLWAHQASLHLCWLCLGILALAAMLRLWKKAAESGRQRRRLLLGIPLAVMLAIGVQSICFVYELHTSDMLANASRTGALLTRDLERLLFVGVSLEDSAQADSYLAKVASCYDHGLHLALYDGNGVKFAENSPPVNLAKGNAIACALSEGEGSTAQCVLKISLEQGPRLRKLIAASLDVLTLTIISTILLIELYLSQIRMHEISKFHASPRIILRFFMFIFIFAMDMSLSFIPLRMKELSTSAGHMHDILLSLPVSIEMAATGIGIIAADILLRRFNTRKVVFQGLLLIAAGYLVSMLSQYPWQFIASRGLAGLGYGFVLLTAQVLAVQESKLADMFTGVYSGSLCGVAFGGVLAEDIGFSSVFGIAACILFALLFLLLPMKGKRHPDSLLKMLREAVTFEKNVHIHIQSSRPRQLFSVLFNGQFMWFAALALLPFTVIYVGIINYFLPVYLESEGIGQANIGRLLMLHSLVIIGSSSLLAAWTMKRTSKGFCVAGVGLLGVAALLAIAFLSPLTGCLGGVVLLGLAMALSIPAQSEYMLALNASRRAGVAPSMTVMESVQRVGQVLGPVGVGGAVALAGVMSASLWLGAGFLAVSLVFLFLSDRGKGES